MYSVQEGVAINKARRMELFKPSDTRHRATEFVVCPTWFQFLIQYFFTM